MKRTMLLIMTILAVGVLSSCALFQTLEIYPASVTGMITEVFVDGELETGYSVEWSVSGGDGLITVDYGDGVTEDIPGDGSVLIEHAYAEAGYYEVFFLRDRARGVASVDVRAIEFDLYQPFWTEGQMVGLWEEVLFDPFPRIVNCNNPDSYLTGLWPDNSNTYLIPGPFGDMYDPEKLSTGFEMRIYVVTTDGGGGSAYGKGGEVITGEWVPLQTYRVIADWPWAKPPYPLQVLQKEVCDPENPWIPPEIPENAGAFLVRQETRRVSGGAGKAVQFEIYVGDACSTVSPPVCE